jgi:23S rRNA (adenine2030-N6)-methyltransferase
MLSYQHAYHAGNMADVHKHMLLAAALDYLTAKDKPLSYIETHAGRGLYDLGDAAALKTGEAAAGIDRLRDHIDPGHPYARALDRLRTLHGPRAYPGSPLLAALLLRPGDTLHLSELHPAEHAALVRTMAPWPARCHHRDGFETAFSLCPPTPRRGLMLIDPSWEVKSDYDTIPGQIGKLARAWPVGILCLWYPLLRSGVHGPMLKRLDAAHPEALRHEIRFPPARADHGMIGSGLFVINPPFGLDRQTETVSRLFAEAARASRMP